MRHGLTASVGWPQHDSRVWHLRRRARLAVVALVLAAALALGSLAMARPAAAQWATVTVPPSGSTVAIPGPFAGPFGTFEGPYFPMSWSCSGEFWRLWFDSNTNPIGWPAGGTDSVSQEFSPTTWRTPLLIRGSRVDLPATGTITGRFECQNPNAPFGVQTIPFSTTVTYAVGPAGVTPPSGGPPYTGPTSPTVAATTAARIRAFKEAKKVLERDRRKMLHAVEELEEANHVFCGVAGSLSTLSGLHAFQWNGAHVVREKVLEEVEIHSFCEAIPDLVKAAVDANRKLDYNRKLIRQLEQQIKTLELSAGLASSARTTALASSATDLTAARVRSPLAALKAQRKQALAAIGAVAAAIGNGPLERVKPLAQSAASRLAALPASCDTAKRYLKKSGLGNRLSRARILRALRQLKASSLPRPVVTFARALHISRTQMKGLIRRAKSVPKAHIKATAGSDLVCSPKLDAIDKSLADTLRTLANAL